MNKNKKALSTIVSTLLIILLAFVVAGVLWEVLNNILKENTEKSKACFGSFGKVEINNLYTCYDQPNKVLKFGIERKNFDLDSIAVSVTSEGQSYVFSIPTTSGSVAGLKNFNLGDIVVAPSKNSGSSYYLNLILVGLTEPTSINIAPIINEYQCDVSDSLDIIETCEPI